MNDNVKELEKIIEKTHGGTAKFIKSVPISETFDGKKVWEGVVNIFSLDGHKTAKICYAWSHEVERANKRRFYVVLKLPPINTPQDAVRAAIIQEYRSKQK